MTSEYEKAVERRARAILKAADELHTDDKSVDIYFAQTEHSGDCTKQPWTCNKCYVDMYRRQARATLKADEAAGYALVPRNATEGMVSKFSGACHGRGATPNATVTADGLTATIESGRVKEE